ncbi:MAG: hypothetical protein ACR2KK_03815 [Acidimicrobiales bacterium]
MEFLTAAIRRGAWMGIAAALVVVVAVDPASGAPETNRPSGPVAVVLVPDLTWRTAPPALDRFAKASLSMRSAGPRSTAEDTYLT